MGGPFGQRPTRFYLGSVIHIRHMMSILDRGLQTLTRSWMATVVIKAQKRIIPIVSILLRPFMIVNTYLLDRISEARWYTHDRVLVHTWPSCQAGRDKHHEGRDEIHLRSRVKQRHFSGRRPYSQRHLRRLQIATKGVNSWFTRGGVEHTRLIYRKRTG